MMRNMFVQPQEFLVSRYDCLENLPYCIVLGQRMPALQATAVFIIFVLTSGLTLKGIGCPKLQKKSSHGSRCTVLDT